MKSLVYRAAQISAGAAILAGIGLAMKASGAPVWAYMVIFGFFGLALSIAAE